MSDLSTRLNLPFIKPSQAQKHVTHNEALRILDAIVQLVVRDAALTQPPPAPELGARYVVAPGATGAWAGQDRSVALFGPTGWEFFAPQEGWRADDLATGLQLRFDGTDWQQTGAPPATLPELGLNTTADATNRLSVAADATLLSHDGAGHQLKLNKNAGTDTASLLFQTSWSGRAEMGTTGSDDLVIKVSADGASWSDALRVAAGDGAVTMVRSLRILETLREDLPDADTVPAGTVMMVLGNLGWPEMTYSNGSSWRFIRNGNPFIFG